jgi:hypothetical protein
MAALCALEHDPTAQGQRLRALRAASPPFERFTLLVAEHHRIEHGLAHLSSHRRLTTEPNALPETKIPSRMTIYDSGH